jgi:hypothetical protein
MRTSQRFRFGNEKNYRNKPAALCSRSSRILRTVYVPLSRPRVAAVLFRAGTGSNNT